MLVYPVAPGIPLNETKGGIHLRSLVFALSDNLEAAGQALLDALLLNHPPHPSSSFAKP